MRSLLADNPLLVLFIVCAVGSALGRVRVGQVSIGVGGVLIAGLAMGAADAAFALPEFVYQFGLAIFVYAMGLACGPTFVAALRRGGLRRNLLGFGAVLAVAGVALLAAHTYGQGGASASGLFTGVLTNAPGLAAAMDALGHAHHGAGRNSLVVAYSLAYPAAVVTSIVTVAIAQRLLHVRYRDEARAAGLPDGDDGLVDQTVEVAKPQRVGEVVDALDGRVVLTRIAHGGDVRLASDHDTLLRSGDLVTVVGPRDAVADATDVLGRRASASLTSDRGVLDSRRIFVSDPQLAGVPVGELDLWARFGARVTRVRRGDADLVAHDDSVLELGDRVRVVAPPARMREVAALFGDSYRSLAEIDFSALAVGITAGLALGLIRVPLPGGLAISLGSAGGPLIAGLVLGARRRTGPLTWQLPYSANISLRQLGLVLFLAGIGTRAGHAFITTAFTVTGAAVLAWSVGLTVLASLIVLWGGHRLARLPFSVCTGVLAGAMTQPATLAFATEQAGNELPDAAYTAVYPMAMLAKVLLAQLIAPLP